MRRADRLFRLIERLRGGRLVTARRLADALEVSERTIYRDVRDLMASGVPIEGEAGVGYVLRAGFDIPPLMFDAAEIEAVALGLRIAEAWGGARLADASVRAMRKIEAVLPPRLRERVGQTRLHAPAFHVPSAVRDMVDRMHAAIDATRLVDLSYLDVAGAATSRRVRPLGLMFWGGTWTLAAWCELRQDFRSFRLDRIAAAAPGDVFPRDTARDFEAYMRMVRQGASERP